MASRAQYYRRIFQAYLLPGNSHLDFWHEPPQANPRAPISHLGEYYMGFERKAQYAGHHGEAGIPMLDYRGGTGLQYNPIAIAQWGLGNYNLYCRTGAPDRQNNFLRAADWLCAHLEQNRFGVWVWNHHFDWEYRDRLEAPWYSALAQGQGISLLVRAFAATSNPQYTTAAQRAFASFVTPISDGGVTFTDECGDLWFEEYIVSPPTHILNGFIWAAWGVYDYFLSTRSPDVERVFASAVDTLRRNLRSYDLGFWSLYEHSATRLQMIASPFYHRLHIVQLRVMQRITGEALFGQVADRWERYAGKRVNRARALGYKTAFKLCYY
ncbi:MAG TPA: D-glucuronyl C5-epimerase family protein [Terriglobales bacterium]|nr:D-glucuronyl C5-epimerase family protein [Terriglobales bacterium]